MMLRRGYALLLTLTTIILLTALSTATLFTITAHTRISTTATLHEQLFSTTERVLWQTVHTTDVSTLPLHGTLSNTILTPPITTTVTITKLTPTIFWIVASSVLPTTPISMHHRLGLTATGTSSVLIPINWTDLY